MFKSSKSTYPSTPKIHSISLPDDSATSSFSWFRSANKGSSKLKGITPHILPQRSMTPVPPERVRRDSLSTAHSSRTRTSSMSSTSSQVPPKSILKPTKVEIPLMEKTHNIPPPSKKIIHTPLTAASGKEKESARNQHSQTYAGQFKQPKIPDGRKHSMDAMASSKHSSKVGHPSDSVRSSWAFSSKTLCDGYATDNPPSSRGFSYSKHHRGSSGGGLHCVLVTEAPLKDEAISLSWPLVDINQRRRDHQPLLYFDIGFDPRYDMNVRIYRGGVYSRMTSQEGDTPVSSHCTVTKMVIVCKELSRWPVTVERSEGLRCLDVFYGIYKTFHEPLTAREKREIDRSYLERCLSAFEQRCKDSPGLFEWNRQQGLRRVDLLRGHRIFRGIKQSGAEWTLMMERS